MLPWKQAEIKQVYVFIWHFSLVNIFFYGFNIMITLFQIHLGQNTNPKSKNHGLQGNFSSLYQNKIYGVT